MQWNYLIIGCSIVLITLLIWKEIGRRNRKFLILRILCSTVAVCSLAAIVIPVSYTVKVAEEATGTVILLTEGAEPDSLEKFLKGRKLPVFSTNEELTKRFRRFRPKQVSGIDYLVSMHPDRNLEIFGYGLEPYETEHFSGRNFQFHPSKGPDGIISASWPMKLDLGQQFTVQGMLNQTGGKPVKLVLKAFGHTVDSVQIASERAGFELTTIPKQLGRSLFSLIALSGNDTLSHDPVPVTIESPEPINVLMLTAAPDFENKFLKNWLEENGYGVAVRTRISKDKFGRSFTNTQRVDFARLTSQALSRFQIIIADHLELTSLSSPELAAVEEAVERQGMGLVVNTDSIIKNGFYARHFPIRREKKAGPAMHLKLVSGANQQIRLQDARDLFILPVPGTQPLLTDEKNNLLISRKLLGTGCVLVSTLQKTYPLILQGDERSYSTLWSSILTTAVRKMMPVQWRFPHFPRIDEPMALEFSATPLAVPLVSAGGIQLHPEQHMQLRSQWKSVFWPGKPGWTSFERAGAPPVSVFIYGPDDWKGVQLMERLKNTRLIADGAKQGPAIHKELRESVRTVPGICFMLIFLICCAFLWYETKILSR